MTGILLGVINIIMAAWNYEKGNYRTAIFCALCAGICIGLGIATLNK